MSEFTPAIIFVTCVAGVYVLAAALLLRRWLRSPDEPPDRGERWLTRGVLGLAAIGVVCFVYGWRIEPYWLEVTHLRIVSAKLPPGGTVRIVQISDLHCDPKARLENRLPSVVAAEKPDLIVFTGDTVNSADALPLFKDCMWRLATLAPVFAIEGNWDVWRWQKLRPFEGTGARQLDREAIKLQIRGAELWLAGVA